MRNIRSYFSLQDTKSDARPAKNDQIPDCNATAITAVDTVVVIARGVKNVAHTVIEKLIFDLAQKLLSLAYRSE